MRRIADIGAAVIGTGFIGTVHVEALRRIGVQVRGVLGSTPGRGQARADALGVPRAYASLDALLADPAVEVVHVTSPNDLHLPQARAILAARRHVVCEKPLAMDATESRELVELAAGSGLINAVNFNIRYYPLNQHAHQGYPVLDSSGRLVGVVTRSNLIQPSLPEDLSGRTVGQLITRKLLPHEPVIGLIFIEGVDDLVAVSPRVGIVIVMDVAPTVGIAGHVEPMPRPALSVMR